MKELRRCDSMLFYAAAATAILKQRCDCDKKIAAEKLSDDLGGSCQRETAARPCETARLQRDLASLLPEVMGRSRRANLARSNRRHPPTPPAALPSALRTRARRAMPTTPKIIGIARRSARRFAQLLPCSTRDLSALAGTRRGRREAEHHLGHAREPGVGLRDDR